ncbi:MAG: alkaline phosphatase, partial [Chloroflexi bacterium]
MTQRGAALLALLLAACTPSAAPSVNPTPGPTEPAASPAEAAVILAAGDIAACDSVGDEATAAMLDGLEGTILVAGDLAYPEGTAADFASCYDPSWGRHKDRTWPVPGNHEYETDGAAGYFDYWADGVGDPAEGWYAFDVGEWRIIGLNSNCEEIGGCGAESAQGVWLGEELETNQRACTLAYWHHPRWSSGAEHGSSAATDALWRLLHDAGADLVLTAHDHQYERFVPMNADGEADPDGLVEFVVGTGGRSLYGFAEILPTSATHDNA